MCSAYQKQEAGAWIGGFIRSWELVKKKKKEISKSIRSKRLTQWWVTALDQKGLQKAIRKAEAFYWRAELFSCISFLCSEHQGITNRKPFCWNFFSFGWFYNTEEQLSKILNCQYMKEKKFTRPARHASSEETKILDYMKTTTVPEDWR